VKYAQEPGYELSRLNYFKYKSRFTEELKHKLKEQASQYGCFGLSMYMEALNYFKHNPNAPLTDIEWYKLN
jgi:hypothetical protein